MEDISMHRRGGERKREKEERIKAKNPPPPFSIIMQSGYEEKQ